MAVRKKLPMGMVMYREIELRACLVIRGSKRNLMKMRTHFYKFSVNSRTIRIKFGRSGAIFMRLQPIHQLPNKLLRACLIIRGSKRNLMKMRTHFHKFSVNSGTIDIKFGGIGAIFMGLQPIHQLSNLKSISVP